MDPTELETLRRTLDATQRALLIMDNSIEVWENAIEISKELNRQLATTLERAEKFYAEQKKNADSKP